MFATINVAAFVFVLALAVAALAAIGFTFRSELAPRLAVARERFGQWRKTRVKAVASVVAPRESDENFDPRDWPVKTKTFRVAGVTFANPDGTERQALIKQCKAGMPIVLRHEPENPADPRAIAVWLPTASVPRQLGYVERREAGGVGRLLATKKGRVEVSIGELTGGTRGKPMRGVVVKIEIFEA